MTEAETNTPVVITLGCRLNTFESEVIRDGARAAGLTGAVIINTCAVTAEAERQARQTIRRVRRERPAARIIVTGCAAQLNPDAFAAMEEVDRVVGNAEKLDAHSLAGDAPAAESPASGASVQVSDIMAGRSFAGQSFTSKTAPPPLIGGMEGRTRAFVQVQQGCDHRCTFCVIPFARGPNRSLPAEHIVRQVRQLTATGHGEVVLTGVDVSSYGQDLPRPRTLGELAGEILHGAAELRRLRLTSLDPGRRDEAMFRLLADEPRFMPHLHLSLQAVSDMVLKRMKRRHTRADAFDYVEEARRARPGVVFGADLIAGFPTETDAMFEETLSAVAEMGLTYLHVFPYSPRPGTPAAAMPQVPAEVRRERAARLRQAGDAALARFLRSRVGSTTEVLVEKDNSGHCPHYAPVDLDFGAPAGAIVPIRVTGANGQRLSGSATT